MLQQRPNTFAQTNLSTPFFACDKAADHTFLFADKPGVDAFEAHPCHTTRRYPDLLPTFMVLWWPDGTIIWGR